MNTIFKINTNDSHKTLKVCIFNVLSRGLSHGEFLCDKGDKEVTSFGERWPKLSKMISDIFKGGVAIVSTVENDHPEWLLEHINIPNVKMVKLLKYAPDTISNSKKIGKSNVDNGFTGGIKDTELALELDKRGYQNDTLTVYYNSLLVDHIDDETSSFVIKEDSLKGDTFAGFVKFREIQSANEFGLVNAHLSSGEGVKDSKDRLTESNYILDFIKQKKQLAIITTMDSNSSNKYESVNGGLDDDVLELFKENGYFNGVHIEGSECFKMRTGAGGQPNKFGSLMYDSIDRIFFPSKGFSLIDSLDITELCDFKKVDTVLTKHEINHINYIRQSPIERKKLKKIVTGNRDIGLYPWSDKVGYGKNHPTGVKEVVKKGKTTLVPLYTGPHYLGDIPLLDDSFSILTKKECMALYPNSSNPSDHPPCVCEFTLD